MRRATRALRAEQFAYSLLTAQPAHRPREPAPARRGLARAARALVRRAQAGAAADRSRVPPMFTPFTLRGVTLKNRVVVSPMAHVLAAVDGVPGDFHLVHLGARALGGAGLVFTEMTCVAPDARITPGLRRPVERRAGAPPGRASSTSCTPAAAPKIGMQLGHAGPKGSTQRRLGRR
ncbi:MAG: hypothetical protein MZW92_17540 [Comamonadaceae bacterium]|nr:hypothetical protein [Comamonadaceae bacterium]